MKLEYGLPQYLTFDTSILPDWDENNKNGRLNLYSWIQSDFRLIYNSDDIHAIQKPVKQTRYEADKINVRKELSFIYNTPHNLKIPWPYAEVDDNEILDGDTEPTEFLNYYALAIQSPLHEFKCLLTHLINELYLIDDLEEPETYWIHTVLDYQYDNFSGERRDFLKFIKIHLKIRAKDIFLKEWNSTAVIDPFDKFSLKSDYEVVQNEEDIEEIRSWFTDLQNDYYKIVKKRVKEWLKEQYSILEKRDRIDSLVLRPTSTPESDLVGSTIVDRYSKGWAWVEKIDFGIKKIDRADWLKKLEFEARQVRFDLRASLLTQNYAN